MAVESPSFLSNEQIIAQLIPSLGAILNLDGGELIHDPLTPNKSYVFFHNVRLESGDTRQIVLKYYQNGSPVTEIAAYDILKENDYPVKAPILYVYGENNGSAYTLTSRLPGETIMSFWNNIHLGQYEGLFHCIFDELSKFRSIPTNGKFAPIAVPSWFGRTNNLANFVTKGHLRTFRFLKGSGLIDNDYKKKHMEWVEQNVGIADKSPIFFCHGDPIDKNMMVKEGGNFSGFIDYDHAYYGPLVKDAADIVYCFYLQGDYDSLETIITEAETHGFNIKQLLYYLVLKTFAQAGREYQRGDVEKSEFYLKQMEIFKKFFKEV